MTNEAKRQRLLAALMTRVRTSEVGVLGELRSPSHGSTLFSRPENFYEGRTLARAIADLHALSQRWLMLVPDPTSRFAQYSILDQRLCLLGRCQGLVLMHPHRDSWHTELELTLDALMAWWLDEDLPTRLGLPEGPPPGSSLCNSPLLEVEHENFIEILLWAIALVDLPADHPDVTALAPLAGGALVAPVLARCRGLSSWAYTVMSRYDRQLAFLENSRARWLSHLQPGSSVFIVDDNVGTGATLKAVADEARSARLSVVGTAAVQSHWAKIRRKQEGENCEVIDLSSRPLLSPFAYLHYSTRRGLIERWRRRESTPTLLEHLHESRSLIDRVRTNAVGYPAQTAETRVAVLDEILAAGLSANA